MALTLANLTALVRDHRYNSSETVLEPSLINVYLNGEQREVPENLTLAALLDWLKLPADRVAVERNREIASRSTWAETLIQADDHLEVVHFVGGGVEVEIRSQRQGSGNRNYKPGVRSQKLGDRSYEPGVRSQVTEARSERLEFWIWRLEWAWALRHRQSFRLLTPVS